jgi:hypothetical protein
MRETWFTY